LTYRVKFGLIASALI